MVDNAAAIPKLLPSVPFEPGKGDDGNLGYEDPGKIWWPKAWALPTGKYATIHPIEGEAIQAADLAMDEHDNARSDWGNPGKNHQALNTWDD